MLKSAFLCLGLLLLPGCFFIKDAPPGDSTASSAEAPTPGSASVSPKPDASSVEAEKALTQEEGHPFWVVLGGTLGFFAAAAVVVLMTL